MDISSFMADDGALGTRTHLSEIGIRIPTHMSILPFYLKGGVMFFEEFRLFCDYVHGITKLPVCVCYRKNYRDLQFQKLRHTACAYYF